MAADDHAHDLPEGDLDGVGVLEHGQNKLACDVMDGVAQVNSGHAPATMEVAIFAVAQRRGNRMWGGRPRPPTLFADVLTARDTILVKRHDECSTSICHFESAPVHFVIPNPRPLCHSESALAVRNLLLFRNLGLKRVTGKIRETKEL